MIVDVIERSRGVWRGEGRPCAVNTVFEDLVAGIVLPPKDSVSHALKASRISEARRGASSLKSIRAALSILYKLLSESEEVLNASIVKRDITHDLAMTEPSPLLLLRSKAFLLLSFEGLRGGSTPRIDLAARLRVDFFDFFRGLDESLRRVARAAWCSAKGVKAGASRDSSRHCCRSSRRLGSLALGAHLTIP